MRGLVPKVLPLKALIVAALLLTSCGSDDGGTSASVDSQPVGDKLPEEAVRACLEEQGVKTSSQAAGLDPKLARNSTGSFSGRFKGRNDFGATVDHVNFLTYEDRSDAVTAEKAISQELGEARRVDVSKNLIAIFGVTRSQAQTIAVLDCLGDEAAETYREKLAQPSTG